MTIEGPDEYFSKRIYTPRSLLRDLRGILNQPPGWGAKDGDGGIGRAFAEKIMLAVTAVNGCRYCSYAHSRSALANGIGEEEIDRLLSGEVGHVSPEEAPALLFAQHYAESGGQPDPEMVRRLEETYGEDKSQQILAYIRMITLGNLTGNTFDAALSRLQGRPAQGSSLGSELATLALLVVGTPVLAVGMLAKRAAQALGLGHDREGSGSG
jgi:AhpD family alkylhydroperoxidase